MTQEQRIKALAEHIATKLKEVRDNVILTDTITGDKYKISIENGVIVSNPVV